MAELEFSFDPSMLKKVFIVGFLLVVFALEVGLTLNNPIAFGDEGFHVNNARYIGTQIDYTHSTPHFGSELQVERFNRPPLWNLSEASFYYLFGFNEAFVKILVPFMAFMTGLAIYVFVKRLYNENIAIVSAAIAVTIPSFVTYSVLFYTTVPYVFFFTMGFLSLLVAIKEDSRKFWILAGLFSGLAILANIAGLFLAFLVFGMGLLYLAKNRKLSSIAEALKTYGVVFVIMMLVIAPWVSRNVALFYQDGCYNPQDIVTGNCYAPIAEVEGTDAEFTGRTNLGGAEGSILSFGLASYLQFSYGFTNPNSTLNLIGLAFIPFSFLAGLVIIGVRRKMSDYALMLSVVIFLLILYWLGSIFAGRAEDTSRYFLSAIPLIAILAGTYWASIRKDNHKMNTAIVMLVMVVVISLTFTSFYQKVGQMDQVKDFVPSFFETCEWVDNNLPQDANLLSLHTHPTRYNCDRGAIWEFSDKENVLLSNDVEIITSSLNRHGIDHIFVQKFAISSQALSQAYPITFIQILEENENFVKIYENGPSLEECLPRGFCDGGIIYRVE